MAIPVDPLHIPMFIPRGPMPKSAFPRAERTRHDEKNPRAERQRSYPDAVAGNPVTLTREQKVEGALHDAARTYETVRLPDGNAYAMTERGWVLVESKRGGSGKRRRRIEKRQARKAENIEKNSPKRRPW